MTAADQPTAFTEWCSQPDDHCLNGTCHYGDHGPLTADAEDALRGGGYGSYIDEAEEVDAADQPTTEPSARQAIIDALDEQGAFCGTCGRQPGDPVEDCKDCAEVLGKYADALLVVLARVAPLLALAPQPAADTETEVQWGVRVENGQIVDWGDIEPPPAVLGQGRTKVKQHVTRTVTPWEEA